MMSFKSEEDLEEHLRDLLQAHFREHDSRKVCLDSKGYTDLFLTRTDVNAIFSIEVKWYKRENRRIHVGDGDGKGMQLDLLRTEFPFMKQSVRWVIGSGELDGVLFLTGDEVLRHVHGGVTRGQQNNISPKVMDVHAPVSLDDFPSLVSAWMDESIHH